MYVRITFCVYVGAHAKFNNVHMPTATSTCSGPSSCLTSRRVSHARSSLQIPQKVYLKPWSQIPLRTPYERFLTIYATVKNRSYGVRKGICDQGFSSGTDARPTQHYRIFRVPQSNSAEHICLLLVFFPDAI